MLNITLSTAEMLALEPVTGYAWQLLLVLLAFFLAAVHIIFMAAVIADYHLLDNEPFDAAAPPELTPREIIDKVLTRANPHRKFKCPICQDRGFRPMRLQCGHIFCDLCIRATLTVRDGCPVCMKTIFQEQPKPQKVHHVSVRDIVITSVQLLPLVLGLAILNEYLLSQNDPFGKGMGYFILFLETLLHSLQLNIMAEYCWETFVGKAVPFRATTDSTMVLLGAVVDLWAQCLRFSALAFDLIWCLPCGILYVVKHRRQEFEWLAQELRPLREWWRQGFGEAN